MYRDGSIDSPSEQLDELKRWAVDLLPVFRGALEPRIKALNLDAVTAASTEEVAS